MSTQIIANEQDTRGHKVVDLVDLVAEQPNGTLRDFHGGGHRRTRNRSHKATGKTPKRCGEPLCGAGACRRTPMKNG